MTKKDKLFGDEYVAPPQKPESAPTVIGVTTVVIGNVSSTGKLDIQGRVKGDIETSSDLVVSGIVEGNVQGKNVVMQSASVKGNVEALHDVVMRKAVILGDVKANNVILDGKMRGNLAIQESTELTANAILAGNVDTKTLSTNPGAKINGTITTREANLKDSDFNFESPENTSTFQVSGTVIEEAEDAEAEEKER